MFTALRLSVTTWRDKRRRARKLLQRAQVADVAVISIGKSGRTWLRAMFSHLYARRHGLPQEMVIDFDNLHRLNDRVPRILFTGVAATDRAPTGRAWGHELLVAPRVVLLTRDPRDVAVSFYFQLTERASRRELARKDIHSLTELKRMAMADFLMDERLGVPRVLRFLRSWEEAIEKHPQSLRISYEELRHDTVGVFRRLARFVDSGVTEDEIAAAVAFAEFGAMQMREKQGFFASERLQPGSRGAPEGFKVRRGKVGGYRDYLTPEEVAAVDRLVETKAAAR